MGPSQASTRMGLPLSRRWLISYQRMEISTYIAFVFTRGSALMWDTYSLLDVGPTAKGEIIEPMTKNLLDAGKWLKYAGDCVYGTVCLTFHS